MRRFLSAIKIFTIAVLAAALSSCAASNKAGVNTKTEYTLKNNLPIWVFNPNTDGYIGGVGRVSDISGGYIAKKRIAKSIAIASIARTIRSDIKVIEKISQQNKGATYSSHFKEDVRINTNKYLSNLVIKDEWNSSSGFYYIWLVIEKQ